MMPSLTYADIISVSQITLQGTVPPMRYLVVNNQNKIIEVTSNTTVYVQPSVYRNKIAINNQISLTPLINQEYKTLGQQYNLYKVGVVYQSISSSPKTKKPLPLYLSMLTWHNYDNLVSSIFSHELTF